MSNDVRHRTREILRAELADAAATFCAEHGFDGVTAEEIAHGIGVSRATFFRYFASKEEAVVSAARGSAERADTFARLVAQAMGAAETDTTIWTVLRTAAEPMAARAATRGDSLRARIRMISDVPALEQHLASQRRTDQSAVAEALVEHLRDERTAHALAASGVAAIDLAWHEWAFTPNSELGPLLDAYFSAFANVTTAQLT